MIDNVNNIDYNTMIGNWYIIDNIKLKCQVIGFRNHDHDYYFMFGINEDVAEKLKLTNNHKLTIDNIENHKVPKELQHYKYTYCVYTLINKQIGLSYINKCSECL